jgi:hypothetical protein
MSRINEVKKSVPKMISREWLKNNQDCIFVFGDNTIRDGYGGAALLRDEPNSYGFVTKKYPDNRNESFYTIEEYVNVYIDEVDKLKRFIEENPDKIFLMTKIGDNLANRFGIFEQIIAPNIMSDLGKYQNIVWLW